MQSIRRRKIIFEYLRNLLLHVKGAKRLLTYNGVMHPSFKKSAKARMLLEDDSEWEKCFEEAISLKCCCS